MKLPVKAINNLLNRGNLRIFFVILFTLLGVFALAQSAGNGSVSVPSINLGIGSGTDKEQLSSSLRILALLTILSIAPAILILTTAFTRIVIILSFTRTALGAQNIPPNQVIIGLSLFLTMFIMAPTYQKINNEAIAPYMRETNPISFEMAVQKAEAPIKEFMLKNTYESDLLMFMEFKNQKAATRADVDIMTLIPAFVISELKTSFIIGFYIFVPFIIIDLIVASILMGMGMMMMPPVVVSLPAKILVFVLADGWSVLVRAILSGYM
ncbi:MAG: flagellar type III secretion system pore protein FliP [Fimbriimonadaceae bacterium]|nr:flagellar type III secretion system pore protein FliP [Fimbriimonadaceae bacterium]